MSAGTLHTFTLDNGLTVWLRPDRAEPRVAARVLIRAGAAREPASHTGLAHLLEHLLANKGSARLGSSDPEAEAPHLAKLRVLVERRHRLPAQARPELDAELRAAGAAAGRFLVPNELKQAFAALGVRGVNAFTSHDMTAYVADIPSHRLEAWAALEADRLSGPAFRGALTELDTVLEEKLRGADDPDRCFALACNRALWADHPYGRDVLGELEHLLNPSFDTLSAFFRAWYTPHNIFVMLSGDLDPDSARARLEPFFGALTGDPPPQAPLPLPAALRGETTLELEHHGDEELRLVWQVPGWGSPEHEALLLLDMVLSNHATGLLDRSLVQTQRVRAAGSQLALRSAGGSFTVWARPRAGDTVDSMRALLLEQVEALCAGDFDAGALAAAATNFEVHERGRLEQNPNAALMMALAATHGQSWERSRAWLDRMRALDKAAIVQVAGRILGPDRIMALRRAGRPQIPSARALGLGAPEARAAEGSRFAAYALTLQGPAPAPQVLRLGQDAQLQDLPWGRLYTTPNPYGNGLGQLTLSFDQGTGQDPLWAVALRLWERAGADGLSLEQLSEALYQRACSMSCSPGRWNTRLHLAGPLEQLPQALDLLNRRLRASQPDEEERQAFLNDLIARRHERALTRDKRVSALSSYALLGRACPEIAERLPDEALRALDLEALRARPPQLIEQRRTVFLAGPEAAEPWLAPLAALSEAPARHLDVPPQRYAALDRPRIFVMDHDGAQASVQLLLPDAQGVAGPDPLPGLWAEYLGGSAGLIFQELREARGLAYSARAGYGLGSRPIDDNLLWASVGTQPARAAQTIQLLIELLQRPLDLTRLERARRAALESMRNHRVLWRQVGPSLEAWACRGLEGDPRPQMAKLLEELPAQALDPLAERARLGPLRFCVVGDLKQLDLSGLAQLADLEQVEPSLLLTLGDVAADPSDQSSG